MLYIGIFHHSLFFKKSKLNFLLKIKKVPAINVAAIVIPFAYRALLSEISALIISPCRRDFIQFGLIFFGLNFKFVIFMSPFRKYCRRSVLSLRNSVCSSFSISHVPHLNYRAIMISLLLFLF